MRQTIDLSAPDQCVELAAVFLIGAFEAERLQLTGLIGTYVPDVGPAGQIAYEYEIAGDFAADIVVGSRNSQTFCMIATCRATSCQRGHSSSGPHLLPWAARLHRCLDL